MADRLAVALLAAGRSTRFGAADKLLASLGGRPMIDRAAGLGQSLEACARFAVTGPDTDMPASLAGYHRLINHDPAAGLASSLRLAVRAAETVGARSLLVLLADMPLVTAEHLQSLLAAHHGEDSRPVFSVADGIARPPAIIPAKFWPRLLAMSGDRGARDLAVAAILVEAPSDLLLDIDTPADLARAEALIAASGTSLSG